MPVDVLFGIKFSQKKITFVLIRDEGDFFNEYHWKKTAVTFIDFPKVVQIHAEAEARCHPVVAPAEHRHWPSRHEDRRTDMYHKIL